MKTRGFALASAIALVSTLFSIVPAQADEGDWRPGWCREDEGLSVVVDYGPEGMDEFTDLDLPVEGWDIRCLIGGEITVDDDYTRITALKAVGFELEGDGYITGINGVTEGSEGSWMFSGADIAAGEAWSQDRWNIAQFGPNINLAMGVRYSSDWDDFVPRPNAVYGAAGVPTTPNAPSVTVSGYDATVDWDAAAGNGAAVSGYTVTLTPISGEPVVQTVTGTSATFADLPSGTWTATVVATNATGDSDASATSAAFTIDERPAPVPSAVAPVLKASTPTTTWGSRVTSTVTVGSAARGTVSGTLNGRTATATVKDGRAVLAWPAKTLRPGKASIRISFASADPAAWTNASTTSSISVAKTTAKVKVTPAKTKVKRSKRVKLTVRVTGKAGDRATGKVTVTFRGKRTTATLKSGKAVVKVKATRKLGKASAKVTFVGDGLHGKASATSKKIRTVR